MLLSLLIAVAVDIVVILLSLLTQGMFKFFLLPGPVSDVLFFCHCVVLLVLVVLAEKARRECKLVMGGWEHVQDFWITSFALSMVVGILLLWLNTKLTNGPLTGDPMGILVVGAVFGIVCFLGIFAGIRGIIATDKVERGY